MKLSKNLKIIFLTIVLCNLNCIRCNLFEQKYKYSGDIILTKYEWLKDRKIFLDPGHGGTGKSDLFRIGPGNITEEEVNLRVALILEDMLKKAGAKVSMSRRKDDNIPLRDRVDMVKEIKPELLISIHHNGTARRVDDVNYPAVLIWGNRHVRPLSYCFAELVIEEFHRIMDEKGKILSDFAVFTETGTMILRETRYICPGIIGEPGFFSDEKHAKRLSDIQYNQLEAEAYFYAIGEFFKRGIPTAEVSISSPIDRSTFLKFLVKDKNPVIVLKLDSGTEGVGIDKKSLKVTLDCIPIRHKAISDNLFLIDYGKRLYAGGHRINFSFKNMRNQSSMIYRTGFTIEIEKGDYNRLIARGCKLVKRRKTAKEGLKMLLSALNLGITDPGADKIIWNIAKGFSLIGDRANSDYYYAKIYHFYPESKYIKRLRNRVWGYRFPVEYLGKWIEIKHNPSLCDYRQ